MKHHICDLRFKDVTSVGLFLDVVSPDGKPSAACILPVGSPTGVWSPTDLEVRSMGYDDLQRRGASYSNDRRITFDDSPPSSIELLIREADSTRTALLSPPSISVPYRVTLPDMRRLGLTGGRLEAGQLRFIVQSQVTRHNTLKFRFVVVLQGQDIDPTTGYRRTDVLVSADPVFCAHAGRGDLPSVLERDSGTELLLDAVARISVERLLDLARVRVQQLTTGVRCLAREDDAGSRELARVTHANREIDRVDAQKQAASDAARGRAKAAAEVAGEADQAHEAADQWAEMEQSLRVTIELLDEELAGLPPGTVTTCLEPPPPGPPPSSQYKKMEICREPMGANTWGVVC